MSDKPPYAYVTTFCNRAHRVSDGKPIQHECYVLPPEALRLEIADKVPEAIEVLQRLGKGPIHRGLPK